MPSDLLDQLEWLEWSGLPAELNRARNGAWPVLRKLAELDCRANREPGGIEVSAEELAERCGMAVDAIGKCLEVLRKRALLKYYLPEEPSEAGLLEIITPLPTPLSPKDVAQRVHSATLRDTSAYRYTRVAVASSADTAKVQAVVDLYLNHLSQRMNSLVLEQIQIAARRFELEEIERIVQRADRHNLRNMGWVIKELLREEAKTRAEQRAAEPRNKK